MGGVDRIPAHVGAEYVGGHDGVVGFVVAGEAPKLVVVAEGVEGMQAGVDVGLVLLLERVLAEIALRVGDESLFLNR